MRQKKKLTAPCFFVYKFVHNSQTNENEKCVRIVLYFRKMGRDTKGEDKMIRILVVEDDEN